MVVVAESSGCGSVLDRDSEFQMGRKKKSKQNKNVNLMDPSSSSKHPPPCSSSSSSASADKCPKPILLAGELTTLSSNMDRERFKWEVLINAAKANNNLWPSILSDVLTHLMLELVSTDMKNKVITDLTLDHANKIVKSFDKDQLEEWKVGTQNGVKGKGWTNLIECHTYFSDYQIIWSHLIATTAELQILNCSWEWMRRLTNSESV